MGRKPTAVPAANPTIDDLDVLQHELGNVVHGVACIAGLLRESGLDARQRRWLATIDQACGQISGIVEHARRRRLNPADPPRTVRLNGVALLEDTLLAHAPAAAGAGVDLMLRVAPALPAYWRSDPCLLRQLLDNLVSNAVRYARNGSVRLEASPAPDAGGTLVIRVLDSGPGVEDLERLFEPRWRGVAGCDGPPGDGLGLYICRAIVETLGGSIRCRNRHAGGACFEVRLPGALPDDVCNWPPLRALGGVACRLELDSDRADCVGALLTRLGVAWRPGRSAVADAPRAELYCVVRRAGRGPGAASGLMILVEHPRSAVPPVHVPAPVLESSLESALYRLLLEGRGAIPREARG